MIARELQKKSLFCNNHQLFHMVKKALCDILELKFKSFIVLLRGKPEKDWFPS